MVIAGSQLIRWRWRWQVALQVRASFSVKIVLHAEAAWVLRAGSLTGTGRIEWCKIYPADVKAGLKVRVPVPAPVFVKQFLIANIQCTVLIGGAFCRKIARWIQRTASSLVMLEGHASWYFVAHCFASLGNRGKVSMSMPSFLKRIQNWSASPQVAFPKLDCAIGKKQDFSMISHPIISITGDHQKHYLMSKLNGTHIDDGNFTYWNSW